MSGVSLRGAVVAIAVVLPAIVSAQDLAGRWLVTVQDDNRQLVGTLEIEQSGEGYAAWLEGGPASVVQDGNKVVVTADSRDIRGFVFDRLMEGGG